MSKSQAGEKRYSPSVLEEPDNRRDDDHFDHHDLKHHDHNGSKIRPEEGWGNDHPNGRKEERCKNMCEGLDRVRGFLCKLVRR
mmetsp:Transcript_18840/g.33459  ORF Transcript_18840/g.33459 Transcript_18840/m.33459 type:complete len:83 (+) Transcript_18840:289-537(+)